MDPIKRLLMAAMPQPEVMELDLPEPPTEELGGLSSSEAQLACPHCGSLDVAVQQVDDAEVENQPTDDVEYPGEEGVEEVTELMICRSCTSEFPVINSPISAEGAVIEAIMRRGARITRASRTEGLENGHVRAAILR